MSYSSRNEKTNARCLVEASAWRTHLAEAGVETTGAFEAWLAADERNKDAWARVQEPWDFFGEQATSPELLELRRAALGQAQDVGRKRWRTSFLSTPGVRASLIAASLVLVVIAAVFVWNLQRPDTYRTAPGERRVVTLADGSTISLDSQSEVRVRYTDTARDLTLPQGQARFDVAHDVERPFSVLAAGQKVVATGTAFNVDLLGKTLFVTLIEGRVVIVPQAAFASLPSPSQPRGSGAGDESLPDTGKFGIELDAGEQLIVSSSGTSNVVSANVERATAWQSGQLVFDNEPLSSVIERVNRYSARSLSLADERAAELRISGVFNTGDIGSFVDTLTRYMPVDAEETNGSIRLSHR